VLKPEIDENGIASRLAAQGLKAQANLVGMLLMAVNYFQKVAQDDARWGLQKRSLRKRISFDLRIWPQEA
jgi:hypothetical protein